MRPVTRLLIICHSLKDGGMIILLCILQWYCLKYFDALIAQGTKIYFAPPLEETYKNIRCFPKEINLIHAPSTSVESKCFCIIRYRGVKKEEFTTK